MNNSYHTYEGSFFIRVDRRRVCLGFTFDTGTFDGFFSIMLGWISLKSDLKWENYDFLVK